MSKKILFISHDANRAGGQIFLLSIMQYFQQKGMQMHLLLLDSGVLENEFAKVCEISIYPKPKNANDFTSKVLRKIGLNSAEKKAQTERNTLIEKLSQQHFDLIYVNTIASAWIIKELDFLNIPIITHIHELEFSLQLYSTKTVRDYAFAKSDKIIACSQSVADNLLEKHTIDPNKIQVIHSFIDNDGIKKRIESANNELIREKYSLPKDKFLVGGCGNAEWRKGLDIFLLVARKAIDKNPDLHFVWIGVPKVGELYEKMLYDIEKLDISKNITLIEPTSQAVELLNSLDVFTLVSREDPFPLVMLEAALAGKPIVGFQKTGGCQEFVEADAGFVVPYLDADAMAEQIDVCAKDTDLSQKLGKIAQNKVLNKFNFETSVKKIEELILTTLNN